MDIYILGIESSCDDTSAAVLKNNKVLANVIANQSVHEKYGGVVPELASRAHQQNIIPVVDTALSNANIHKNQLDAIAFTNGPGLLGSLLVGTTFSKTFSLALDIPMIQVNHLQAHILAHFIDDDNKSFPSFPFLCLTVSGGHTQIVLVKEHLEYEIIGSTIDDASGEAFDKAAKTLGLPYPGGPMIQKYAGKGNPNAFTFTYPNIPKYDYSFSGLKTSFLYLIRDQLKLDKNFIKENICDLAASIQKAIVEILLIKLVKAAKDFEINEVAVAGGVSANMLLRDRLIETATQEKWSLYIPKFEYCTDNAAMIGVTGYYKFVNKQFSNLDIVPYTRIV